MALSEANANMHGVGHTEMYAHTWCREQLIRCKDSEGLLHRIPVILEVIFCLGEFTLCLSMIITTYV